MNRRGIDERDVIIWCNSGDDKEKAGCLCLIFLGSGMTLIYINISPTRLSCSSSQPAWVVTWTAFDLCMRKGFDWLRNVWTYAVNAYQILLILLADSSFSSLPCVCVPSFLSSSRLLSNHRYMITHPTTQHHVQGIDRALSMLINSLVSWLSMWFWWTYVPVIWVSFTWTIIEWHNFSIHPPPYTQIACGMPSRMTVPSTISSQPFVVFRRQPFLRFFKSITNCPR